jgi:hypothetical protein
MVGFEVCNWTNNVQYCSLLIIKNFTQKILEKYKKSWKYSFINLFLIFLLILFHIHMDHLMHFQVSRVVEPFPTKLTFIWFFPSVYSVVHFQIPWCWKSSDTNITNVWLFPSMFPHVDFEVSRRSWYCSTNLTLQRVLIHGWGLRLANRLKEQDFNIWHILMDLITTLFTWSIWKGPGPGLNVEWDHGRSWY